MAEYLNVAEVADELGCGNRRVLSLITDGHLRARKIQNRWKITRTEVERRKRRLQKRTT